jgi:hypothetical protein
MSGNAERSGSTERRGTIRAPQSFVGGLCLLALAALALYLTRDLRGPVFVAAAIIAFALSIRTVGLAVAGPLTILISGFASEDTRWKETIIFSILMTLFCIGLFRFALNQPMPILIIPGLIYI